MKQKFKKYWRVRITNDSWKLEEPFIATWRNTYPKGTEWIVEGTYSQLCGGEGRDTYSLYPIKRGRVVNNCSWIHESELELVDKKVIANLKLVEAYEDRDSWE